MRRIFLATLVALSFAIPGHANDMTQEIETATAKLMPKIIEWRRHIH